VIAGDNQGNLLSSFPLSDDGNYKYWAFSDPYKATVSKSDGTDVEEDIYEAYNISLLVTGQKASIAEGHGVRLNGEKYMHTRVRGARGRALLTPHGAHSPSPPTSPPPPLLRPARCWRVRRTLQKLRMRTATRRAPSP
jgi:hypothetical protein